MATSSPKSLRCCLEHHHTPKYSIRFLFLFLLLYATIVRQFFYKINSFVIIRRILTRFFLKKCLFVHCEIPIQDDTYSHFSSGVALQLLHYGLVLFLLQQVHINLSCKIAVTSIMVHTLGFNLNINLINIQFNAFSN